MTSHSTAASCITLSLLALAMKPQPGLSQNCQKLRQTGRNTALAQCALQSQRITPVIDMHVIPTQATVDLHYAMWTIGFVATALIVAMIRELIR